MPRLYDLTREKPPALVDERINTKGEIRKPLDPADAERVVSSLPAEGVAAIAVSGPAGGVVGAQALARTMSWAASG